MKKIYYNYIILLLVIIFFPFCDKKIKTLYDIEERVLVSTDENTLIDSVAYKYVTNNTLSTSEVFISKKYFLKNIKQTEPNQYITNYYILKNGKDLYVSENTYDSILDYYVYFDINSSDRKKNTLGFDFIDSTNLGYQFYGKSPNDGIIFDDMYYQTDKQLKIESIKDNEYIDLKLAKIKKYKSYEIEGDDGISIPFNFNKKKNINNYRNLIQRKY